MKTLFRRCLSLSLVLILVGSISFFSFSNHSKAATKHYYYVHKTSNLYSSTKSSKKKLKTISINVRLSTYSSKTSSMYKVTYSGKTGYVYKANLSTKPTYVTRYVKKTANLYNNTSTHKKKMTSIPINTKLTTTSPLSDKLYKVNYKGKNGYVYSDNLSSTKVKVPQKTTYHFGDTARIGDLKVTVSYPINLDPYYAFEDDFSDVNNVVEFKVSVTNIGKEAHYIDTTDFDLYKNNISQDEYYPLYHDESISGNIHPGDSVRGSLYYETNENSSLKLTFDNYQYDSNFNKIKAISFYGRN
ncbi:DUF4352 domain-containing protein [Terrilactibacillus laevilacticus]|uniref:DUF4352 domain-containing protein n=1 Tax=Terrilactibacillus laevilacticus TaxID=1380157 RepID=UPI0011477B8C|nr:DUF4352 domain-containing protein [Terrilactibacillus laevilacticus]